MLMEDIAGSGASMWITDRDLSNVRYHKNCSMFGRYAGNCPNHRKHQHGRQHQQRKEDGDDSGGEIHCLHHKPTTHCDANYRAQHKQGTGNANVATDQTLRVGSEARLTFQNRTSNRDVPIRLFRHPK